MNGIQEFGMMDVNEKLIAKMVIEEALKLDTTGHVDVFLRTCTSWFDGGDGVGFKSDEEYQSIQRLGRAFIADGPPTIPPPVPPRPRRPGVSSGITGDGNVDNGNGNGMLPTIMNESWDVGVCKSSDLKAKLNVLGTEDGLFLVRKMAGKDQLAFLVGGTVQILYIRNVNKRYVLDGQVTPPAFDTVAQLVAHYTYNPLPLQNLTILLKTSIVGHY